MLVSLNSVTSTPRWNKLHDWLPQRGLAAEHIEQLLKKLNSQHYQQIHSLLVYKNDLLVIEEYFVGNDDYIDFDHNVSRVASPSPVQWTRGAK